MKAISNTKRARRWIIASWTIAIVGSACVVAEFCIALMTGGNPAGAVTLTLFPAVLGTALCRYRAEPAFDLKYDRSDSEDHE